MKSIGVCLVCMCFVFEGFAQQREDTIAIRQRLGVAFEMNGRTKKPRQLLSHMKPYKEAFEEMQIAKTNHDIATAFWVAGGILIAWPIGAAIDYPVGTAIGDRQNPNWTLAGIGAGVWLMTIPFSAAYGKHAKRAVRIYNRQQKTYNEDDVGVDLGWSVQGMALRLTF